ncbi:hypothetical protein Tco_0472272 [Tanacetum coccineum]
MSINDLYNNFKIVEQSVKKSVGASSGAQNLAFMTASSTSSTNDINTAKPAYEVSTVSPNVNVATPQQDLEKIYEDDLEAMDLKWQLSLLSMRAKRYYQRTCKKIFINANNTDGNQDNTRKQGNNEDTSSKAMLAIDGVGFDWSDMAEEQCDDLIVKLNQTEFTAATYKRGLATVEEQLITYRKNEVLFSEEVAVLKREVACKDYEINVLKSEFEKVKQEKDGIEFKIEKFDKASKDLDQLLGSQITDKSKKGLGYSAVPPPHPLIYNRPKKLDLSYSGLDEFKEPEFKGYGPENSEQESNVVCDKKSDDSKENSDESLVEEQVSQDTSSFVESSLNVDKETVFPVDKKVELAKPKNHEKPVKRSVRNVKRGRDTKIPQSSGPFVKVGDEAVHKELGDRIERAATTASSLEAEQDSGNINKTQSMATLNDINSLGNGFQAMLRLPVQVPAAEVLDLEKAKDAQAKEIAALKKRVQKLERKKTSRTTGLKRPQEVDETQERQDDELMFDTGVLDADEIPVEAKVDEKDEQSTKLDDSIVGEAVTTASVKDSAAPTTIEEITLAQTLIQIKAAKPKVVTTAATTTTTTRPKAKGVVAQEPSEFRVSQKAQSSIYKDKGKGDFVNRKSTSGICTFVRCRLTSWFSKKQTALAISTTEAESVSP